MNKIIRNLLILFLCISGSLVATPRSQIRFQNLLVNEGIGQDIVHGLRYGDATYYEIIKFDTILEYQDWTQGKYYLEFCNDYGEWVKVSTTPLGTEEVGTYTLRMWGDWYNNTVRFDLIKNE